MAREGITGLLVTSPVVGFTVPLDWAVPSPQSIVAALPSILPTTSENDVPSTGSTSS